MTEIADPPVKSPAPPAAEDPNVEFHKPKPFHNWREFLKEYAIIVLGVATALAAEQVVESLHWQSKVREARQAIIAEMQSNNDRFFSRRVGIVACLQRQARETERILDDLQAKRPAGTITAFHMGSGALLNASEWESQRASQTLTHFPNDEVSMMGSYYDQLADVKIWIQREGQAWRTLSVLQHPPAEVTGSDLLRLRAALADANSFDALIVLTAGKELQWSQQLNIPIKPWDAARVREYCDRETLY